MTTLEGQIGLFEWMPQALPTYKPPVDYSKLVEPDIGEWVESPGAVICHVMRPSYIGRKVLVDMSTESHKWFKVGLLERYIPYNGAFRSIVYTGTKQRSLVTHLPGVEIYEVLPWDAYKARVDSIGKN